MWSEAVGEGGRWVGCWAAAWCFALVMAAAPAAATIVAARMRHHDLHALAHGCRSSVVNLEARSMSSWSTSRHCIIVKLQDISVDHFLDIRAKAGALLILLPKDLNDLSTSEKQHLHILESAMSAQEITIPVYFIPWSSEINTVINDLSANTPNDEKSNSALDSIVELAFSNGYQIVINAALPQKQESKVATLHGQLMGQEMIGKAATTKEINKLPTIAIVAHYDSSTVAPEFSFGADSNASGVCVLLELVRIFSQLYSTSSTRGPVNLVFLLTGAAHMNYYSTKKWIEDQLDSVDGSIIQDASFVLCLDSLASDSSVVMHVSKPPKEGSPISLFSNHLNLAAENEGTVAIDSIHKKINLADENLAWEHERFSIRRLPAFTLSALKSHKSPSRSSLSDNYDSINMKSLTANTQVIANALAGYLYNVSSSDYSAIFSGSLQVDPASIESWMRYLTSQSRATQFVSQPHPQNPMINSLSEALRRYLPDLSVTHYMPDKRDPEFSTYSPTSAVLNIYNVKPAIFDLILTIAIMLYLGVVYLLIFKFPWIYQQICRLSFNSATKAYKQQ